MIKKIARIFFILCIAAIGASFWTYKQINTYLSSPVLFNENKLVQVVEGANYHSFTDYLINQKAINPSPWSRWAVKLYPELTKIKAGVYNIEGKITIRALFEQVSNAKPHQFSITFIEGSTFKDWRATFAKTEHLLNKTSALTETEILEKLDLPYQKIEGLLMPDTYHYSFGDSDMDILQRAAKEMQLALAASWDEKVADLPIANPYALLTLASIIEKETALDKERGQVASVFINRLNKKMRLQTDPTVIYGMGDAYNGNITRKDLRTPTPYNTYVINGLPPTPIAMPSRASLKAAATPANTEYFYFVADGKGGHVFSITLQEHNKAVRAYLQTLREKKE